MWRALSIGVGYGVIAYICLSFTRFGAPVESIWLSNALLTAALVTMPYRAWPLTIVCAAAGHVAAHLSTGDSLGFTLALLSGDMIESALCAAVLGMRPRTLAFRNRVDIFYFLFVCGACALLSGAIATGASWLTNRALGREDFFVWFSADALALIVFMPIFRGFSEGRWRRLRARPWRLAAAVAAVAGLSLIAGIYVQVPTLRLMVFPVLVVIAFDLGVAAVEICLAALLLTWAVLTFEGRPPTPWSEMDMRTYMVVVQVFIAIFAVTILPLAVAIEEKQRLNETLTDCLKETREAWGAVIGAEARYRLVVDNVSETVMRVGRDGVVLFASPACVALFHVDKIEGRNLFDLLHPEDECVARERFDQCLKLGLLNLSHRWSWRIADESGEWAPIEARVTLVSPGGAGHEEFLVVASPLEITTELVGAAELSEAKAAN